MIEQSFYNYLLTILKKDTRFLDEDGDIIRNAVIDKALKYDDALLTSLLDDKKLKEVFFKEVSRSTVFLQNLFIDYIQDKKFLIDSYTKYTQNIGLNIDGKYLKERGEVALVWPFKDCVLEGGQTKEEQKRKEIFFNEVLAKDEIDRLEEPKVLTNFKRYTKDGDEKVFEIKRDEDGNIKDNLIIKGNNLLALHSLKKQFAGKVKLIYIDPPYNTGTDNFGYNDNFSHSTWLTFMRSRLQIAKKLLRKDGLIFVHIDTSRTTGIGSPELAYLSILLDEVFERNNFIANLHWKKKKQPSFLSRVAGVMESILVYSKYESNIYKLAIEKTSDVTTRIDNTSNKVSKRFLEKGIAYMGGKDIVIKKGIYKNKTMTTEFLSDVVIKNGKTQNDFFAKAKFRNTQEEVTRFCREDLLYITEKSSFRRFKDDKEKNNKKAITDLLLDWGDNQDATQELRKLFEITDDSKEFDNPKPELLIANIIRSCTEQEDLVMDFFLGTGTTCAVSHKLNRQYIGIEQLDYINTVTNMRLKKVLAGEKGGISKEVDWQGGGSFIYCELKKYNEEFIDRIQDAKTTNELLSIWEDMKEKSFLNYQVDIKKHEEAIEEFKALPLDKQKKALVELLDKNMLYVPLADIDDADFKVSKEDKALNKQFYG